MSLDDVGSRLVKLDHACHGVEGASQCRCGSLVCSAGFKSVTDTSTAFLVGDHRESRSSIQLLNQIYRAGLPGIAQTSMGETRPGKRKDRIVEELKTDNGRLE